MHSTKQSGRRILSLVLSLLMVLSLFPTMAVSVYADEVGGLTIIATESGVELTSDDYTYENGVLTILSDKAVTIYNTATGDTPVNDKIYVASGVSANITLAGVKIEATSGAPFEIAENSTGNVTVTLAEGTTNTLTSNDNNCAGLQKNGDGDDIGKLTIDGEGTLYASGGKFGAGIGGGDEGSGKNITISGGTVTATGGKHGAGIGGGDNGSGNNITISGGTVTATGGDYGAGIGGGDGGSGNNITISGGTVTTTGGAYYGAGIGGGDEESGKNITISGGTVTATGGGYYGAGIGGGYAGSGENITISGGTVTATGGKHGAGIGGGHTASGENITISGGTVTATGGAYGAGIGGGHTGSGKNITISGGSVKASSISVAPTNGDETESKNVYLLEIVNVSGDGIKITDVSNGTTYMYSMGNHTAIDENDTNLYAYLPVGTYDVQIGKTVYKDVCVEDNDNNKFDPSVKVGQDVVVGSELTIKNTNQNDSDLKYLADYSYESGVLTILSDKEVTISNTNGTNTAVTDRIYVEKDVNANITLEGVNIAPTSGSAFEIAENSTGDVTVTLEVNTVNTLRSPKDCAGLQKNGDGDDIGKLTIDGGGTLYATGGFSGAGIGGGYFRNGENITISGGTITATGGRYGAGIGGGSHGSGNDITISGGTVTATGGDHYGAGIGGGEHGSGNDITISGGTVTATGGDYGAGIGGGYEGSGKNITISAGAVTATGGDYGAGIGGGRYENGNNITISGGTVDATGGIYGAGIGGGYTANGENITISAGTVTATGGKYGAGIGGGDDGSGKNITISGGTVTATGGTFGAGIGGCDDGSGNNITISGGTITAIGGFDGAGIGGGRFDSGENITISGGTVTATGGGGAAGIGGGWYRNGNNITISGGTVTATGGSEADGIGSGLEGDATNIVINGGSVKATNNKITITPTNGDETNPQNVYLLTIANPDSKDVYIDGEKYVPSNHTAIDESDTNLYAYLTGENHWVQVGDGQEQFYVFDGVDSFVLDETAPTAEITVKDNKWTEFLNTITLGLFFKDTQEVTITADDGEIGSGVKSIEYYVDDLTMTPDVPRDIAENGSIDYVGIKWMNYNGAFDINPNSEYVIYARVTDVVGNTCIINSNGLVLDDIKPVINVENHDVFCSAVEIEVDEIYLDTVKVNGKEVEVTDGKFVLTPDEAMESNSVETTDTPDYATKVIEVTDKAGNTTTVTVYVFADHTYGEWVMNENDPTEHIHTCIYCSAIETEKHTGGNATYFDKAICDICHLPYGDTTLDTTNPTAEITVKENKWTEFLNTITFGIFFNETQQVTITANDTESGVKSISYYVDNGTLTPEKITEISEADWTEYNGAFDINPDGKYVIYVKVTDNDGNAVIINSDGLVLDATLPTFSVENGTVFCESAEVTVTDDNIKKVTLNGEEVKLTDGKLTVTPNNGENVITAIDEAGNEAMVTITVYENHDYKDGVCDHCGENDPDYVPPVNTDTDDTDVPNTDTDTDDTDVPNTDTDTEDTDVPNTDTDTEDTDVPNTDTDTDDTDVPNTDTDTEDTDVPNTDTDTDDTDVPNTDTDTDDTDVPNTDTDTDDTDVPNTDTDTDDTDVPNTDTDTDDTDVPNTDTDTEDTDVPNTDTDTDDTDVPNTDTDTDDTDVPNTDTDTDDTDVPDTVTCLYGDVNNDGRITAIDAYLLQRAFVGYHNLSEFEKFIGDVNGDGRINSIDCLDILRKAVGYQPDYMTGQEVDVSAELLKAI